MTYPDDQSTVPPPNIKWHLEHRHNWQALGFRHIDSSQTFVVQSCECGEAREVQANTVYNWQKDEQS